MPTDAKTRILRALSLGATLERTNPFEDVLRPTYRLNGLHCDQEAVEALEAAGLIQLRSPGLVMEFGYSLYTITPAGLSALAQHEAQR